MSKLEDQVEAYTKHGVVPVKWADPELRPSIPDPMELMRQALGEAAIALDCMTGLEGKNAAHRDHARAKLRTVMGA